MSDRVVTLLLNQQQLELMDRTIATGAAVDRVALVHRALAEREKARALRPAPATPDLSGLDDRREVLSELVIEPGTGKALEVMQGQLLRIEQVEGGQCADFNCFNLHDYKEYLHVGRTRTVHGLNPTTGDFLWSAPPRERAMIYILEDTARCNDVLFPRCSAYLYESSYGMPLHTNCHDIQSEAQRDYGLTPDDVHDSFNLFMATHVKDGRGQITRQTTKAGDHVDMLALMDLLAVPNVCGADVMRTSNFSLKPLKATIFKASAKDLASVPALGHYTNQRTPKDFRQPLIRAERGLQRDPNYTPRFTNVPLRLSPLEVSLSEAEQSALAGAGLAIYYGDDEGAALRDVLFSWWETHYLM